MLKYKFANTRKWLLYLCYSKNELIVLFLNKDNNTFEINWIITGSYEETNVFGLIKFSSDFTNATKENIINLPATLIFNETKFNNKKPIKLPIDGNPNMSFDFSTKKLSFYNKTLTPSKEYSLSKCKSLIQSQSNWDGSRINLNDLLIK